MTITEPTRLDGSPDLHRPVSAYAVAFEVLASLQTATHAAEAVEVVLGLAVELTSPMSAGLATTTGALQLHPTSRATDVDVAAVLDLVADRSWGASGSLVAVHVACPGGGFGAMFVEDVGFPDAIDECVSLLLPACEALSRRLAALEARSTPNNGTADPGPAGGGSSCEPGTGVLTEAAGQQVLEQWVRRCGVTGEQLTVVVAGVDTAQVRALDRHADVTVVQRTAADRLNRMLRSTDLVSHFGDDLFLLALRRPPGSTPTLASRVQKALAEPYVVRGEPHRLGASVGSVTSEVVTGSAQDLTADAEAARARNARVLGLAGRMTTGDGDRSTWSAAVASLVDGVIVQDGEGRIVAHSPAAEWALGLPPGSLAHRSVRDDGWRAIHPDGSPFPTHGQPPAVALATGEPVMDVIVGLCLGQDPTRWLNVTAVPLGASPDPTAAAVVSTLTDITDVICARHTHADGYARLRQAVDAFPNPFFILDAERDRNGRIVELRYAHLNRAATSLYGCRAEDVIGRGQVELFPSVLELGIFDRYVAVIETGRTDTIEIPWFDENGVQGSFEVVASRLEDSIVLTATEISERRSLVSRLAASEARFLSTFGDGAIPMALIREPTDTRQRMIVQVNDSMCQLLGFDEQHLLGPISETTPPALGRVLNDFDQLMLTAADGATIECELRHRSGRPGWAELRLTELHDSVPRSRMWLLQCADVTDRHAPDDGAGRGSQHDHLTGLPNMARFIDDVRGALDDMAATRRPVAAMVLNLDDFKSVNTALGLEAGDAYLGRCGRLLAESVGPDDRVTRPGGDEFAILLRDVKDRRRLATLAERTLTMLAEGIDVNGTRISAPASVGLAVATRTSTSETLLSAATTAMREAKARGGSRWNIASPPRALTHNILEIEAELRDAIAGGGLVQRYQPVYDLRTGKLDSVEALTRWTHPTHGIIPPERFVRIAERRNLIGALGDWALETACTQWAQWHDEYGAQAPAMAVNVSTRQLGHRRLVRRLESLLAALSMPADRLWLEVTESQAIDAEGPANEELAAIRQLGVHVSIDDFGTGQAGFSYLRSLPADSLKLDRSFIEEVHTSQVAAAVATSMVALGRGMGLVVVAEGIETPAQLAVMRALGADLGQGWLWSHARAGGDIAELIGVPEWEVRR